MYTLNFTAKMYLYAPVTSQKIIKRVQVDQYTNTDNVAKREQRIVVTPNPTTTLTITLGLTKFILSSKMLIVSTQTAHSTKITNEKVDKLNEILDIVPKTEVEESKPVIPRPNEHEDITSDYKYSRENLYNLVERGYTRRHRCVY